MAQPLVARCEAAAKVGRAHGCGRAHLARVAEKGQGIHVPRKVPPYEPGSRRG